MKKALLPLAALLLVNVAAQPTVPAPGASPTWKSTATKARPQATGKAVLPDPNLLDGSKYEAEKRPLYGMLSEIEMGEEEGGRQDRVSPNSGPQGEAAAGPVAPGGTAGPPQAGGSSEKIEEGPAAQAEGAQARKLTVPEGAQAAGPQQGSAREMQIGDATLQIQTETKSPEVIGTEVSNAQQYEKKVPAGQQSNTRNQGVEKGKIIPKGL